MKRFIFILLLTTLGVVAQPNTPATTSFTRSWLRSADSAAGIANLGLTLTATNVGVINRATTNSNAGLTNLINSVVFRTAPTLPGSFGWLDIYGSNLFRFVPIGNPRTNYYDLFVGDFTPSKETAVNVGDVIFRMTDQGYFGVEFGNVTNSFWMYNLSAYVGDITGNQNQFQLWDAGGNTWSETLTVQTKIVLSGPTTNFIKFGTTNTAPANTTTPSKWISVQVGSETNAYRIPLYQ